MVTWKRYTAQPANVAFPNPAKQWLCFALIRQAAREYGEAAWGCLYAAWACDDRGKTAESAALQCRRKAVVLFVRAQRARALPAEASDSVQSEDLLLIDLLRRCGLFRRASGLCKKALAVPPSGPLDRLLEFELKLIAQGDTAGHSVREVLETAEERQKRWQIEHPPLRKQIKDRIDTIGFVLMLIFIVCVALVWLPLEWVGNSIVRIWRKWNPFGHAM